MKQLVTACLLFVFMQASAQYPAGVTVDKLKEVSMIIDGKEVYVDVWQVTKDGRNIGAVRWSEQRMSDVKGKYDPSTPQFTHSTDFFNTLTDAVQWLVDEDKVTQQRENAASGNFKVASDKWIMAIDEQLKLAYQYPDNWTVGGKMYLPPATGEKQADGTRKMDMSKLRVNPPDYNTISFSNAEARMEMLNMQSFPNSEKLNIAQAGEAYAEVMKPFNIQLNGASDKTINGQAFRVLNVTDYAGTKNVYLTQHKNRIYLFIPGSGTSALVQQKLDNTIDRFLELIKFQ